MRTSGPWRRGIGNEANTVFDSENRVVADRVGFSDGLTIAAVPDMIEALKKIAEYPDEENEWDAVDKYEVVRTIAKTALKKAQINGFSNGEAG